MKTLFSASIFCLFSCFFFLNFSAPDISSSNENVELGASAALCHNLVQELNLLPVPPHTSECGQTAYQNLSTNASIYQSNPSDYNLYALFNQYINYWRVIAECDASVCEDVLCKATKMKECFDNCPEGWSHENIYGFLTNVCGPCNGCCFEGPKLDCCNTNIIMEDWFSTVDCCAMKFTLGKNKGCAQFHSVDYDEDLIPEDCISITQTAEYIIVTVCCGAPGASVTVNATRTCNDFSELISKTWEIQGACLEPDDCCDSYITSEEIDGDGGPECCTVKFTKHFAEGCSDGIQISMSPDLVALGATHEFLGNGMVTMTVCGPSPGDGDYFGSAYFLDCDNQVVREYWYPSCLD